MRKMKQLWVPVAAAILLAGAGGYGWWQENQKFVPLENPDELASNPRAYFQYYERLKEAYANDPYGGETPEETLNLFIEALEEGDVELASKYFVVEKQNSMRTAFDRGIESGGIEVLLSALKKEKIGGFLSETEYRFSTFDDNNAAEFSFDLVLNKQTGKWKMYEL